MHLHLHMQKCICFQKYICWNEPGGTESPETQKLGALKGALCSPLCSMTVILPKRDVYRWICIFFILLAAFTGVLSCLINKSLFYGCPSK